ncbi:FtsX-like permease family protein [Fulvivirga sp. M361]|uniref:ABC transporter permease n=1 Tax=Fulvivirga sp. M361 TaxID=2594266 RepID=UPI00117B6DFB|nr:ABC transporter permease [Fulvivirga sp. M361]TRX57587.1 FtsX-like permease family protein [Fulvivirga sp. M361]
MFRNIIKVTLRNFIKERFYAVINIAGLSLGIAASLLTLLYVLHETSYDTFHPDSDRLFRVNQTLIWSPDGGVMSSTALPLAQVLTDEIPEVESALRINTPGNQVVRFEEDRSLKSYIENDILAADSNFFDFFAFKLKEGDPSEALRGINKVVISNEMAQKYFGDKPALGKTLLFGQGRVPMEVTGVTEPQPTNAHFDFDFLMSIYSNPKIKQFEWSWIWTQVVTYVKLHDTADLPGLEEKFTAIGEKHVRPMLSRIGMHYEKLVGDKGGWNFYLQPVEDIHLYSDVIGNRIGAISDIDYVYIFTIIACLVIVLASINFMNLATARATLRAKETGIRKVMGSPKFQLLAQHLAESIFMCAIAMVIGLGLMELLRIIVQDHLGIIIHMSLWDTPGLLVFILLIPLLLGLFSGLYPAFYLSNVKPVTALKGKSGASRKSFLLRNVLVVAQFATSVALISGTMIVYQQLDYFSNVDVGYERGNIITIDWAHKLGPQLESFRDELKQYNTVQNASISMDAIGRGSYEDIFMDQSGQKEVTIAMMKADEDFLNTLSINLLTGRFFEKDRPSDEKAVVINETTMKLFGWDENDVLGQTIVYTGDENLNAEVIGVVEDFHFQSLRLPVNPYLFFSTEAPIWGDMRVVQVKTMGKDTQPLLAEIEKAWKRRADGFPFQYSFADEEFKYQYRTEQQLGGLFAVFAGFAIFIAAMGLLGLSSYTITVRTKEIGIRKVLGASVAKITLMLNGGFTRLILLSLLIGFPVAWWMMDQWLEQFAKKITIHWSVFIGSGLLALAISWITVAYQSIKAATMDPVDTLRDE